MDDYLQRILRARVYDVAEETPLEQAKILSNRFENEIWLKREDLQPVFSFKLRGAFNRMVQLSKEELLKGVVGLSIWITFTFFSNNVNKNWSSNSMSRLKSSYHF